MENKSNSIYIHDHYIHMRLAFVKCVVWCHFRKHWLSKFSYAKLVKFQIHFKNVYIIQIFDSIYITFVHYITMLSLPFSLEPAWWKTVECWRREIWWDSELETDTDWVWPNMSDSPCNSTVEYNEKNVPTCTIYPTVVQIIQSS